MANATVIQVPAGNDFSALGLGMLLPITTGLDGWWYPGTNGPSSILNRKLGGAPAAVVGTPLYGAGFITCTALSNYLQTQATDTENQTLLAVARKPPAAPAIDGTDATRAVMIANYTGGLGSMLYQRSGSSSTLAGIGQSQAWTVAASITPRQSSLASSDFTAWGFFASVADDVAKVRTLYNKTAVTSIQFSEAGNTRAPNANKFRIGSAFSAAYTGQVDIAFAAVYSVALTSGQIDTIYTFVKSYLSRRGIAI